ncbi:uncharacterized protein RJT21DRAFT_3576 [Scheffersomyces amazonensis]|uniref:uncharacterized protein n=1 Tax=Scheffersomyces amazonensis TaxID=1078765 RepID=UPI00315D76E8
MQFSALLSIATFAATALAADYANTTVTETELSTTLITITSCDEETSCTAKVVPGTAVVSTVTVHGVETIFTTICELTETPAETPVESTPIATVVVVPVTTPAAATTEAPAPEESTAIETIYSTITKGNVTIPTEVPTYEGAANSVKAGIYLLALAPLAGLL